MHLPEHKTTHISFIDYTLPPIEKEFQLMQRKVFGYLVIFLALGVLFSTLTAVLFFKVPSWNYMALFGLGYSAKMLLALFTGSLSIISLWLGTNAKAEIELANKLHEEAKKRLKRAYQRKKAHLLQEEKKTSSTISLEVLYHECLDGMERALKEIHLELDFLAQDISRKETEKQQLRLKAIDLFRSELETLQRSF